MQPESVSSSAGGAGSVAGAGGAGGTAAAALLERIARAPMCLTVRPKPAEVLAVVVDALADEGYPAIEILARPMDETLELFGEIRKMPQRNRIAWGIGTVLSQKDAERVVELRPDFIVSPAFSTRVLAVAVAAGIPYIPAVRTFQDVQDVRDAFEMAGLTARVLKLCPVVGLGPDYVTMLAGCFPGIIYCPTGEMNLENYRYWKRMPHIGAPMGSLFVPPDMLDTRDRELIRRRLRLIREMGA